jgi:hypothetical protein
MALIVACPGPAELYVIKYNLRYKLPVNRT